MIIPERPDNEGKRLEALHSTGLLDIPAEERFDRVTRFASRLFDLEICVVSLIDADRQFNKAMHGLDIREAPRDVSFCGHAILRKEIMEIPDAREDDRFRDNPMVLDEPHVRFYAGAPLSSPEGYRLGTLCLIDSSPRVLSEDERLTLRELADIVQEELNREENARLDRILGERQQLARLSRLAREANTALLKTDTDGLVSWANEHFIAMSGCTLPDIQGKTPEAILAGDKTDSLSLEKLQRTLESLKAARLELLLYRQSGEPFWAHVHCSPITGDGVQFAGYIWVYSDLSRLRELERQEETQLR